MESVISTYILDIGSSFAEFVIYSSVIGLLIGSLQWLILRRRIIRAGWWILILVSGHMISAVVVIAMVTLFRSAMFRMDIITTILYGVLTGAGLVVLLMQSSKEKMSAVILRKSQAQ